MTPEAVHVGPLAQQCLRRFRALLMLSGSGGEDFDRGSQPHQMRAWPAGAETIGVFGGVLR